MNEFSDDMKTLLKSISPSSFSALEKVVEVLQSSDASIDVRSTYATFSVGENLVAAIHPAGESVDVCIALKRDAKDSFLFDPIDYNYKWRNLPCGFTLSTKSDSKKGTELIRKAIEAVQAGDVIEIDGEEFAIPKAAFQPAFKKKYRHR
jgi:hypothetical protein